MLGRTQGCQCCKWTRAILHPLVRTWLLVSPMSGALNELEHRWPYCRASMRNAGLSQAALVVLHWEWGWGWDEGRTTTKLSKWQQRG